MKVAREQATTRKALEENKDAIDGPGKLDNADYAKWQKALMNQLEIILGAKYAPLSYVVLPEYEYDPV